MKTFEKTFGKRFRNLTLVFVVCCVLILLSPLLFTQFHLVDFTKTGQIGDTIGGITAPFIAAVAAYLTFLAFWVQFKANQFQRNDIAIERFNTNFFNLLNIHEEITNNLEFEYRCKGETKAVRGRSAFRFVFWEVIEKITDNTTYEGIRELMLKRGVGYYEEAESPTHFDHYFRCMYRIVKMVDESDVLNEDDRQKEFIKRYEYVAILRSKLSRYELVWLFYNGLSYGEEKFKPLIEKYSLLKNLRTDLLASKKDISLYNSRAFGN